MNQKILFLVLIFFYFFSLSAQEENTKTNFFIDINYGGGGVSGELKDKWAVRQDVGYIRDYYNYSIENTASFFHFGVKPEYRFYNSKFGISAGLQYTSISSSLEKSPYFHLRYKTDDRDTRYARVKNIRESNNYLGIPLEIRFIPFQWKYVGFYFKIGAEFNFNIKSKVNIHFYNKHMDEYEQEILNIIGVSTNPFYSTFYYSPGIKLGKTDGINLNAEIIMPSFIFTSNNFALMTPDFQSGFQLLLQIPIKQLK